ncbi:MAG: formyltransferase family protein [Candidatus Beckwithbacteria bacterium]|nr:formyltransferase family protein [Candidatus Beckwithbacteria bacterium]
MPPISILFFGSSANSAIVKKALIQAGYTLVDQPDKTNLVISADYGQKLKSAGLNLHPSLLPRYRGSTPVPCQILKGETESGISIIQMTDQFDAGPIVAQEKVPILPDDTTPDLLKRCFTKGANLLVNILPAYLNNKITQKKQDESQATFTRKFTKQDGFISWEEFKKSRQSPTLDRKIRALFPWPGVWTTMPNKKTLKLLPKNLLQLEAKQPITWKQFQAGYRQFL